MPDGRPRKLQRASRACDFCHKRSVKCAPSGDDPRKCQNCIDFDVECTFTRPWKRARGSLAAPAGKEQPGSEDGGQADGLLNDGDVRPSSQEYAELASAADPPLRSGSPGKRLYEFDSEMRPHHRPRTSLSEAWKAFAIAAEPTIGALIDVYYTIVYPVFPLFHRARLVERVAQKEYLSDRGFFSTLMALCALASGRTRDRAAPANQERAEISRIPAETFYLAALDAMPKELSSARGLDYLRACAVIAVASIQLGRIEMLHEYIGHYHALLALQRFHDEACWPKDVSVIEREERRRLVWSTYALDVYSSIVWNTPLRSKAGQLAVEYPSEVDDELLSAGQESVSNPNCWLHGWNFITDLYHVMQQSIDESRARRNIVNTRLRRVPALAKAPSSSGNIVMLEVYRAYSIMPTPFKAAPHLTGVPSQDIFGFQFANIQATLALLRMVLFSGEDKNNVETKCEVANQLISVLSNIPMPFLKAIGTPLIYHLAGVGNILSSALEGPLCEINYRNLKVQILSMADLLESLEVNLHRITGVGRGMRQQLEKVDKYMDGHHRLHYPRPFQNTVADLTTSTILAKTPLPPSTATQDPSLWEFQLPPELLEDWPWPSDFSPDYGFFSLSFD